MSRVLDVAQIGDRFFSDLPSRHYEQGMVIPMVVRPTGRGSAKASPAEIVSVVRLVQLVYYASAARSPLRGL